MRDWIYHDSHDLHFRCPFGAVPCGEEITLQLNVLKKHEIEWAKVLLDEKTGGTWEVPMAIRKETAHERIYQARIKASSTPGLMWYSFVIEEKGQRFYYGNNRQRYGGVGEIYWSLPEPYQITVYKRGASTPNWFKEATIYQIFVDRFFNGCEDGKVLNPKKNCLIHAHWENIPVYIRDPKTNKVIRWDFFGGNLHGVMKKLPYFQNLGIRVIYLNPVFESPSNHKYDTGDYHKIDPMYGDNQLFAKLCEEAKKHGISVLLDGVFSHTGSDSIYFNKESRYPSLGAYQSPKSPYFRWYRFFQYPDQYDCWWGVDTLPNVNELEPSYQNFIIFDENSVLKFWQKQGGKGWRLDVADELPDMFIKNFRRTMKERDPESVLIGEVWDDASNKISHGKRREYLLGDELDSVTNYPFRQTVIDFILMRKNACDTHRSFMSLYENYPLHHFYSMINLLGSHDVPRILTVFGGLKDPLSEKRLKLAVALQMTFPGVPCIYYGDEAGMEGGDDPLNRGAFPWGRENAELLGWYKQMIGIRNRHDVLRTGSWHSFYIGEDVYGYIRKIENGCDMFGQKKKDNVAVILFNRNTEKAIPVSIDLSSFCSGNMVDPLKNREIQITSGMLNMTVNPLEAKIILRYIEKLSQGKGDTRC